MPYPCAASLAGRTVSLWLFVLTLVLLAGPDFPPSPTSAADKLIIYSGRAERLIKPVLDAFTAKTDIQVELLSSGTTELLNRLKAEGDRTPADARTTSEARRLEPAGTARIVPPPHVRATDLPRPP